MLTVFCTICMSVIDMPTALVLIIKDSHIEFFFPFFIPPPPANEVVGVYSDPYLLCVAY